MFTLFFSPKDCMCIFRNSVRIFWFFQKLKTLKGQSIWKFGQKCTKSENIWKKCRWLRAIIARSKLLEKALCQSPDCFYFFMAISVARLFLILYGFEGDTCHRNMLYKKTPRHCYSMCIWSNKIEVLSVYPWKRLKDHVFHTKLYPSENLSK